MLALGTGDGQTDVEFRITADLGAGRWGLRGEGMYNRQLAADYILRVAPPTQPLAGLDRLSAVRRDPGDVVRFAVRPFFRLAPTFAIEGTAMHWSRGEDEVSYLTPDDEIPGVDASVLAQDTKASATVLGIGITYSNAGRFREGGGGCRWTRAGGTSASCGRRGARARPAYVSGAVSGVFRIFSASGGQAVRRSGGQASA